MRGIGALLFVAAFFLFGIGAVREKRARIRALGEIGAALELLCAELEPCAEALPEAVKRAARFAVGSGKELLLCLSARFSQLGERSFSDLWREAVRHSGGKLEQQEREELMRLGAILGRCELSTQLRELQSCGAYLSARRQEAERVFPAERRLWIGLSAAAGAFLAILLL